MRDLTRLKNLLKKMTANQAVSMRDFEGAVGKDGVAEYEDLWQRELEQRKIFETKPDCWRRRNTDPPCRSKNDPGRGAAFLSSSCG